MSDGQRTARLVALMAGNSFVFIQMYQLHLESVKLHGYYPLNWTMLLIAIVGFVGIAISYIALRLPENNKWSYWLEFIAAAPLVFAFSLWVGFARFSS
jgi:phosphatidylglycerophosphate synthase